MVDIQTLSIVIATVSVVAGVIYYSFQLRNQSKTRQTDLVVRLYSTFGSKKFLKTWEEIMKREAMDYNDYMKKYGWSEALEVGMFFEGIGVLLHRRLVDIDLVDDLFSGPIKMTWEKMKLLAEEARKHLNHATVSEWFEYLYNEMQKREQSIQQIRQ